MTNLITSRVAVGLIVGLLVASLAGVFTWFSLQPYLDFTSANPARVTATYESQNPAAYNEEEFKTEFVAAVTEAAERTGNDPTRVQVVFHDNVAVGKTLASVNYSPNRTVHSRIEVFLPYVREAYDHGLQATARDIAHHEYGHVLQNHYVEANAVQGWGSAVYTVTYDHGMDDTHEYFHSVYDHPEVDGSEVFADCFSWSLEPGRWVGYMETEQAREFCSTDASAEAVHLIASA